MQFHLKIARYLPKVATLESKIRTVAQVLHDTQLTGRTFVTFCFPCCLTANSP